MDLSQFMVEPKDYKISEKITSAPDYYRERPILDFFVIIGSIFTIFFFSWGCIYAGGKFLLRFSILYLPPAIFTFYLLLGNITSNRELPSRRQRYIENYNSSCDRENVIKYQESIDEARSLSELVKDCLNQINQTISSLPPCLIECNNELNLAEREFREKAYGPFWDAVEHGALSLALFYGNIKKIEGGSNEYTRLLQDRRHNFPPLPIDSSTLPNPQPELERLARIMRLGQTDFQFATIWEQRKTRAAIIEGFNNLGDTIANLSYVVERSIADLSSTVIRSASFLGSIINGNFKQLSREQNANREAIGQFAEEQSRLMREQNRRLDEIRRRL